MAINKTELQNEVKLAMKAKDRLSIDTIRSILAAIQYEEMQKGVENLAEAQITEVLLREHKKRKEEIEFAENGGRGDLKEKSIAELKIIERFLPQQLSSEALEKILTDIKAGTPGANMGVAMKVLKDKFAGQYDSKLASEIAKKLF